MMAAGAAQASLCSAGRLQSPIDIATGATRKIDVPLTFNYQPQPLTIANDGDTVRVRFKPGNALMVGKERYTLQQFHFHTPGGDRIAGEEFPLAAHILHKSASGQLLAVVVLFRTGAAHPLLDTLLPLIPKDLDRDRLIPEQRVNAADLLPARHGYYRYTGSLTALPCTEGVQWIVMKEPVTLSASQLSAYRKRYADNGRAVQPTNQRTVLESP
jgi:carbonic anhydrase